jgi:hypothetical protein
MRGPLLFLPCDIVRSALKADQILARRQRLWYHHQHKYKTPIQMPTIAAAPA